MAHEWWHWGDDEWDDFDYSYDDDGVAQNIQMEVQPDYCVLNF